MSTDYVVFNQVFKMVVKWSNGSKTVVYRRYSLFFDFLVSGENKTQCVMTCNNGAHWKQYTCVCYITNINNPFCTLATHLLRC